MVTALPPAVTRRPPLKWAGGKRWQLPHLEQFWTGNQHRRLVEPFCGGLAVVLGLAPKHALLNDINPHLVNFYRWLKRGLVPRLDMRNRESAFYENRDRFNALIAAGQSDTREAAELFYYLNRTCYNGLCRFNSEGRFNVPFGRYARINYADDFRGYQAVFSGWAFTSLDFENLALDPSDLVYADPPYDVEFTKYTKQGFDWAEQERTAHWLSQHAGPVILSNQATERVKTLYRSLGFELLQLDAPRRISSTGDRSPAQEVLATRNL